MKILITGGCGFVGHHLVEHFLKNTNWEIIIFDKLSYAASGLDRVRDIKAFDDKRVHFFSIDFTREISEGIFKETHDVDYILHVGAETHVDNSIVDPKSFVYSNVVGTFNMLEFARQCMKMGLPDLKAFVYFSTDEVFGPAEIPNYKVIETGILRKPGRGYWKEDKVTYKEWDRYNSTNPYSATKAGGEELVLSYMNTYGLPGFITHCMNIFGERQHPEKFIPKIMRNIIGDKTTIIHGTPDGQNSGSRFYIHARNVANAVHFLLDKFEQREKYNIVGEKELTNLELARHVAHYMGYNDWKYKIVDFHSSRPGHDLRYSLDGNKMKSLGWRVPMTIFDSLKSTVKWTMENEQWMILPEN